jgi:DNA-binding beta-propeller fold protein YncE
MTLKRAIWIVKVVFCYGLLLATTPKEKHPPCESIITSIQCPGILSKGLAYDGESLLVSNFAPTPEILRIDPKDGKILSSVPSPGNNPAGLAWDGECIWVVDLNLEDPVTGSLLYRIDPTEGKVLSCFPLPGIPKARRGGGLTWDGRGLWYCDEKMLYRIHPLSGKVLASFPVPSPYPTGLAWDGKTLLLADSFYHFIYKLNPINGAVISVSTSPVSSPFGLTWDGKFMWGVDLSTNRIFSFVP